VGWYVGWEAVMTMTRKDYYFLTDTIRDIMDSQDTANKRETCRLAFLSLANHIAMSPLYPGFNEALFNRKAKLGRE